MVMCRSRTQVPTSESSHASTVTCPPWFQGMVKTPSGLMFPPKPSWRTQAMSSPAVTDPSDQVTSAASWTWGGAWKGTE